MTGASFFDREDKTLWGQFAEAILEAHKRQMFLAGDLKAEGLLVLVREG